MRKRILEMRARAERAERMEKIQKEEKREFDAKLLQKTQQYQTQTPSLSAGQQLQANNNQTSHQGVSESINTSALNNSVLVGQHDSFNQQLQLGLPQEKSQSVQRRRNRTLNKIEESEQMAKLEE